MKSVTSLFISCLEVFFFKFLHLSITLKVGIYTVFLEQLSSYIAKS